MKVTYVRFGLLVLFFICFYSSLCVGYSDVVWSDDFNDGDFEGWSVGLGEWAVINGTIQSQTPDTERPYCTLSKASSIAYGTWSFDVKLQQGKTLYIAIIQYNGTFATFGYVYQLQILPRTGSTQFIFDKVEGSYPETKEIFTYHTIGEELHGTWHHIDITRELDGKFSFYLDSDLIFEVVDNSIITSEKFVFTSHEYGAFIDNIEVSDEIRIWSDDFDDGDFDGWTVDAGSWEVVNNSLQALFHPGTPQSGGLITHPSSIAFGTWSFDINIQKGKSMAVFFISTNHTWYEYGLGYFFDVYPSIQVSFPFIKLEGVWPADSTDLGDGYAHYNHGQWYHIDVTRDLDGRFCIYFDGECVLDVVDSDVDYSEEFNIASFPIGCILDNILVTEIVKDPMDITIDLDEVHFTQGETITVDFLVKDKSGQPIDSADVKARFGEYEVVASELQEGVYQALLDTSELLGEVEISVIAQKAAYLYSKSISSIEVVSPAEFVFSDLSIDPSSVQIGDNVQVSVEVFNIGGQEGSHLVELKINEVVEDEYVITLDPDSSDTVIFEYTPTQPDKYTVAIDDLSGSFTVTQEVEEIITETEGPLDWIPGFPIAALVLGLLFSVIFFTQRKQ